MAQTSSETHPAQHTNRLAQETSPYLLQHQHNPVDWYPWGPEAFERARREDKPIFLSVGYSTCYWCHVMERQCFEVEAIAAVMNEKFVNVKVDREERPDVDQLYMAAVQVLTRHGGWPMSVFLTPDLRPFYGGTYFPPEDMYGRPGFVTVLNGIDDAYRNRKGDVEKSANQLVGILQRLAEPSAPENPVAVDQNLVDQLVRRSTDDYEPHFGGFGHAPKFPRETLLELLLVYLDAPQQAGGDAAPPIQTPRFKLRDQLTHTLDALAHGGIRDQLGGGFHRYSTDERWLVPHFEVMLYDNAMLGWCYAEAHRQTGDPRYAQVARDVFDFVLRDMTSPDGPFYTAFDAEVDGQEGLNYLWTPREVEKVLTPDEYQRFAKAYGLDRGPNFADPHHGTGRPDKNILFVAMPGGVDGKQSPLLDPDLRALRQKLLDARAKRKQPLLDTKILTSWNALMIRALAHGAKVLGEPRYLDAATRAADFLLNKHRAPNGGLCRTSRDGPAKYAAFLDDYAFLAQALLAIADAGAGLRWKGAAAELAIAMFTRFADEEAGGFYFTDASATELIVRQKTSTDSPLPSGNAVAAIVLLALGQTDAARSVLAAFTEQLATNGEGMSSMVQAVLLYLRRGGEPFTVSSGPAAGDDVERPQSPQRDAENVVNVTATWATPRELRVTLAVAPPFHVNAHDAGGSTDVPLIPTTLHLPDEPTVEAIDYPPGEERAFAFADKPLRVYGGEATIAVRFKADRQGQGPVRLRVSYQACDDRACLAPAAKSVEV